MKWTHWQNREIKWWTWLMFVLGKMNIHEISSNSQCLMYTILEEDRGKIHNGVMKKLVIKWMESELWWSLHIRSWVGHPGVNISRRWRLERSYQISSSEIDPDAEQEWLLYSKNLVIDLAKHVRKYCNINWREKKFGVFWNIWIIEYFTILRERTNTLSPRSSNCECRCLMT